MNKLLLTLVIAACGAPATGMNGPDSGPSTDATAFVSGWTEISGQDAPQRRQNHAAAYDSSRNRLVVYGGGSWSEGNTDVMYHDQVWEFDGTLWHLAPSNRGPSFRVDAAMAFDGNTVIHFGGLGGGTFDPQNDTWSWNGSTWTLRTPAHVPPARSRHAMAYDSARRRIVMFGGSSDYEFSRNSVLGDTWEWDGQDWQGVSTTGPSPRANISMAYDSVRRRTVLVGGATSADRFGVDETWEWDGEVWTQASAATSPGARTSYSIAYDASASQIVLFGGLKPVAGGASQVLAPDLWVRGSDGAWSSSGLAGPPLRFGGTLSYDESTHSSILFGGFRFGGQIGDTWRLVAR